MIYVPSIQSSLCSLGFALLIATRAMEGGGAISMALFFIKPRSLFDASMKNLFESIVRELMTYIIINDVEIFTRELS